MTSFTSTGQPFYLGFLFWHMWMTNPPRACVNTCAQVCTKLTHVLSRKVLSLTKPKGKIHKTKPLRHYITSGSLCPFSCVYSYTLFTLIYWIPLCGLSIFAILLRLVYSCFDIVLVALFCAAIRRDSVSLLRFPFLSRVQVFSSETSLVCRLKYPYSCFSSHFFWLFLFCWCLCRLYSF